MIPRNTTLSADQLSQVRDELQRALTRLRRSTSANGNGRPSEIDQSAVGRLSRIEAIQNQGLTQSLQDREHRQLEQVMDALARMEAGTYGLCTSCHAPIRFERLLVFPEAPNCNQCGAA